MAEEREYDVMYVFSYGKTFRVKAKDEDEAIDKADELAEAEVAGQDRNEVEIEMDGVEEVLTEEERRIETEEFLRKKAEAIEKPVREMTQKLKDWDGNQESWKK